MELMIFYIQFKQSANLQYYWQLKVQDSTKLIVLMKVLALANQLTFS